MDEQTRDEVARRAASRCEYCHLPVANVVTTFQVEHIIARKHGGKDTLTNLAYACLHCNLHKGSNIGGIDPKTNKLYRLFNPRLHQWHWHFRWEGPILIGKSAIGRTTVEVLSVNDPARVALRQELMNQGLFPPQGRGFAK